MPCNGSGTRRFIRRRERRAWREVETDEMGRQTGRKRAVRTVKGGFREGQKGGENARNRENRERNSGNRERAGVAGPFIRDDTWHTWRWQVMI